MSNVIITRNYMPFQKTWISHTYHFNMEVKVIVEKVNKLLVCPQIIIS